MQVQTFLDTIKANDSLPILFDYGNGRIVQGGYHVTEIKNASYETIDCGNSRHTWNEVIIQLWVPEEAKPEDPMMPSSKFLKIWDVVDGRLSLHRDAEIRIEYGDGQSLTSNYHVSGFEVTEDGLVVQMAPPQTMCKPREILIPFTDGKTIDLAQVANAAQRIEKVIPLNINATCCESKDESEIGCC